MAHGVENQVLEASSRAEDAQHGWATARGETVFEDAEDRFVHPLGDLLGDLRGHLLGQESLQHGGFEHGFCPSQDREEPRVIIPQPGEHLRDG